jgi:arsenate reductase
MSDITIYHNPHCSKSRATLALIEERGIKPVVVEYLKTPLDAAGLAEVLNKLGKGPRDILRRKEAALAGIAPDRLDDAALLAAMAAHPEVIERPIVVRGSKAVLGRPPESVLDIL